MNKAVKMISVILFIALVISIFAVPVFADVSVSDFNGASATNTAGLQKFFKEIIGVVKYVGVGIAVIMLTVLAIKYIIAAPSEKADIKKGALIYVVAAIMLFAASGILAVIENFAKGIQP